jgi:hypothetical protein
MIVLRYLKIFLLLLILFWGFALLSCLIPEKAVMRNIEQSLKFMDDQPDYPQMIIYGNQHRPDYAMDGQITNIIYTIDNQDVIKSSLLGRCRMEDNVYVSQWQYVKYNTEHNTLKPNVNYARYWHGNSYFFRIFYSFTNYNEIKWIIFLITSVLMAAFAMSLYREMGGLKAMMVLIGLFLTNVYVMQFSMQQSPVLIITIVISLILFKQMRNKKNPAVLFFVTGAVTTYFDLLTAPLLTLGIPMLIWVSLRNEENKLKEDLISGVRQLILFGTLWLVAYAGAWAIKIAIAIPFADFDLFSDVKNQVMIRTGSAGISRMAAVEANFNFLPLVYINILLLILLITCILSFNRKGIPNAILFVLIATLPYVWFFGAANHSFDHNWFTYRIQAFSISGILLAFNSLIYWEGLNKRWGKQLPRVELNNQQ